VVITILLLAAALGAPPEGPITKKNWHDHPHIAAIRELVQQNEEAIKAKKLEHQEHLCGAGGPVGELQSTDRDASGVIRKYVHAAQSEDSAYRAEAHYDERGRLRFVFAKRYAVPTSSSGEFRVYFDEQGKKIWTDVKKQGPGYTWLPDFPEQWLEKDPEKAWKNPPPCE